MFNLEAQKLNASTYIITNLSCTGQTGRSCAYFSNENGGNRLYYKSRYSKTWEHVDEGQIIGNFHYRHLCFMIAKANALETIACSVRPISHHETTIRTDRYRKAA